MNGADHDKLLSDEGGAWGGGGRKFKTNSLKSDLEHSATIRKQRQFAQNHGRKYANGLLFTS